MYIYNTYGLTSLYTEWNGYIYIVKTDALNYYYISKKDSCYIYMYLCIINIINQNPLKNNEKIIDIFLV